MNDTHVSPLWYDLSKVWAQIRDIANERDMQKRDFQSSRYWNDDSHFIGLLGEKLMSFPLGLKEPNYALLVRGDGGTDFPEVSMDVKASVHWRDPYLKHNADKPLLTTFYGLVALDMEKKRGYVAGWAKAEELLLAPLKDWGKGERLSLPASALHPIATLPVQLPNFHYCHCGRWGSFRSSSSGRWACWNHR